MSMEYFAGQNKNEVVIVPPGEGPSRWAFGDRYTVKSGEHNTGKSLFIIEALVPEGGGPPLHVHHWEEEAFYVLEGTVEFRDKNGKHEAPAGSFIFVPRGTEHAFKNVSPEPAKMLFMTVPGGKERFFLNVGVPADDDTPPPSEEQRLKDVAYGYEVGPEFGDEYLE
ncbi:hypothetical protein GCM10010387_37620 [Streptomyces inusitatus]|uniref:Cupin type-2 domain-containing protein n=1 Tax=Streptomyces inusitatus TaxID=68221 RepID=A0A918UXA5_9ACTN|nr:cupin domain-containing protein [Streptomyces inusitatus]GGZ39757.1 hypothetical protein GCM10010387_37620 [Streptomyces inusitatus]